jgi:hypothetical protein
MKRTVCMIFLAHFLTALSHAQALPGRWEKMEAQSPGTGIVVALKGGERLEGVFTALTASALVLRDAGGRERTIPKIEVASIVTVRGHDDPVKDGAIRGMAIGLLIGAVLPLIPKATSGGEISYSEGIGAIPLGAGAGAAIGWWTDRSRKAPELLYRSR